MKPETILDAMVKAVEGACDEDYFDWYRDERRRQHTAFRARILRMDAEKELRIAELQLLNHEYIVLFAAKDARIAELEYNADAYEKRIAELIDDKWNLKDEIAYYKGTLAKKDTRIAELEEEVESLELRIGNIAFDLRHGG